MQYKVKQEMTLLDALAIMHPESTKNTLRTMILDGRVQVDSRPASQAKLPLTIGQTVEVGPRQLKKAGPMPIVYEDQHLIVVDKPAGLLSVATPYENKNTAHAILKRKYSPKKVFVIHRLDQETSGLLMFAFTEQAYEVLKQELERHHVERIYLGVVEGTLKGKGTWRSHLTEDEQYVVHSSPTPSETSELAITHYETELNRKEHTLVRFRLETGKKNQIRVHAQVAGHPIYGDSKYKAELPKARRLYLHAHELRFNHPITKKPLSFTSPIPKEFLRTLSLPKYP